MNKFIVYGLLNPITNELRYIGKSSSGLSRPKAHFKPSAKSKKYPVSLWAYKYIKKNLRPSIIVLEECLNEKELNEAECFNIEYFRSLGSRLLNMSSGGEGQKGLKHSQQAKEKIKKAMVGRVFTDAWKKNISDAKIGKPLIRSDEGKNRHLKSVTGIKQSEKTIQKRLETFKKINYKGGMLGKSHSEDHKAKIRARFKCISVVDQHGTVYPSIANAAKVLGLNPGNIRNVIAERSKSAKGYKFKLAA